MGVTWNDLKIKAGLIYKIIKGQQVGVESMREAGNHMAQCCGVYCSKCGSYLRLPDQTTDTGQTLYFKDSKLYANIDGVEREVSLEPLD